MPRSATAAPAPTSRRRFLGLAGAGTLGAATLGQLAVAETAAAATTAPELGYAESVVETATKTGVAVPNLAVQVQLGAVPVCVEYGGYVSSTAANGCVKLYLMRDGKAVHEVGATVAGSGGLTHLVGRHRIPAGAAKSSIFTVMVANWAAPTATARLIGAPLSPAFVLVREL